MRRDLAVLLRKLSTMLLILLSVPVIILIRALRPLILIRFGKLFSSRIGHFAANPELYLCNREINKNGKRTFDIFYYEDLVCNQQLKKMWGRSEKLRISPFTRFTQTIDRVNQLLPASERHTIATSSRDAYGLRARTKPQLSFTKQEEQFGRDELRKLGIADGSPFICFHARDSAYLEATLPSRASLSGRSWDYHNYRDSDICNYIFAAEELVHRGYFAVRMGAIVKKPLPTTNPMIIDYAVNNRTDFLDIYLGAKCKFFICDTAGIWAIAEVFRRPIVWVNFIPLEDIHTWRKEELIISKKLWSRREHRFLTFREILNSGIGRFFHSEKYEQLGIEVIENTPEEIADVAVEMEERLEGKWQTSEEDEQLQQRFWQLFKPNDLNRVFLSRIGAKFLRQNRKLLE